MAFLKKKKAGKKARPPKMDHGLIVSLALQLEKAKLGDYVTLMGKPWRNIWVNFVAGVARGAGMAVGTVLVGGLVVILTVQALKIVAKHSDMVPWFGAQVKEAVGFVLEAANEKLEEAEQ